MISKKNKYKNRKSIKIKKRGGAGFAKRFSTLRNTVLFRKSIPLSPKQNATTDPTYNLMNELPLLLYTIKTHTSYIKKMFILPSYIIQRPFKTETNEQKKIMLDVGIIIDNNIKKSEEIIINSIKLIAYIILKKKKYSFQFYRH